MNRTVFIWIAASTAALLCLGACADFDKLDGTRTSDNRPAPNAPQAAAYDASVASASASAEQTGIDREQSKATHN